MKTTYLVVAALKEEMQDHFIQEGIPVLYTGVGKINAAYHLTRELTRLRYESQNKSQGKSQLPDVVINFGTAGSSVFKTHSLVECTRFAQRDMDLTPLGLPHGVTPFESEPAVIEVPKRLLKLETGWCGTGDSFETSAPKVQCDVVDMEAYALAKICRAEKIPFISVKYITDGSDHNAHNDWAENLPRAAASFIEIYKEIVQASLR